jgi:alpha-1,2-mannosyltransferase
MIGSMVFAAGLVLGLALHGRQVDIDVYLMGGAHAGASDLYSLQFDNLYFTYPPFAAIIFAPLSHLARTPAQVVWGELNVLILIWLIAASIRASSPDPPLRKVLRWSLLLVAPALLLDPVLETAYLGQVNTLVAALVVADLAVGVPKLPRGILTGLAAAIKLTPLIFILYLVLTRQYRAACWAAGTFTLAGVIAAIVSPTASWLFWTKEMFDPSRAGGLLSISNQNLISAAMRIAHGPVPGSVLVPLLAAVLITGLALSVWAYRTSSQALGVLVCATTGLVVSPITWSHHLVWVVLAIAWLALAKDAPAHGRRWALVVAIFFWAGPIWWVPVADRGLHEHVWEIVVGDSFLWVMLAFLAGVAVLLVQRLRRRRSEVSAAL